MGVECVLPSSYSNAMQQQQPLLTKNMKLIKLFCSCHHSHSHIASHLNLFIIFCRLWSVVDHHFAAEGWMKSTQSCSCRRYVSSQCLNYHLTRGWFIESGILDVILRVIEWKPLDEWEIREDITLTNCPAPPFVCNSIVVVCGTGWGGEL